MPDTGDEIAKATIKLEVDTSSVKSEVEAVRLPSKKVKVEFVAGPQPTKQWQEWERKYQRGPTPPSPHYSPGRAPGSAAHYFKSKTQLEEEQRKEIEREEHFSQQRERVGKERAERTRKRAQALQSLTPSEIRSLGLGASKTLGESFSGPRSKKEDLESGQVAEDRFHRNIRWKQAQAEEQEVKKAIQLQSTVAKKEEQAQRLVATQTQREGRWESSARQMDAQLQWKKNRDSIAESIIAKLPKEEQEYERTEKERKKSGVSSHLWYSPGGPGAKFGFKGATGHYQRRGPGMIGRRGVRKLGTEFEKLSDKVATTASTFGQFQRGTNPFFIGAGLIRFLTSGVGLGTMGLMAGGGAAYLSVKYAKEQRKQAGEFESRMQKVQQPPSLQGMTPQGMLESSKSLLENYRGYRSSGYGTVLDSMSRERQYKNLNQNQDPAWISWKQSWANTGTQIQNQGSAVVRWAKDQLSDVEANRVGSQKIKGMSLEEQKRRRQEWEATHPDDVKKTIFGGPTATTDEKYREYEGRIELKAQQDKMARIQNDVAKWRQGNIDAYVAQHPMLQFGFQRGTVEAFQGIAGGGTVVGQAGQVSPMEMEREKAKMQAEMAKIPGMGLPAGPAQTELIEALNTLTTAINNQNPFGM